MRVADFFEGVYTVLKEPKGWLYETECIEKEEVLDKIRNSFSQEMPFEKRGTVFYRNKKLGYLLAELLKKNDFSTLYKTYDAPSCHFFKIKLKTNPAADVSLLIKYTSGILGNEWAYAVVGRSLLKIFKKRKKIYNLKYDIHKADNDLVINPMTLDERIRDLFDSYICKK